MKVLVPMSGPDTAFREAGYAHCKSLIEIAGKALVQHVYENLSGLGAQQFVFVIRKEDHTQFHLSEVLKLMDSGCRVVVAQGTTAGAACTALLAAGELNPEEELVIANGDQIVEADLGGIIADFRRRKLDGATITFDSIHPRWSYVRTNADGLVVEAAEKRPISRHATAGFYYFRKAADCTAACMAMIRKAAHINGAYYVCPAFNEMILQQAKIGIFTIAPQQYYSLATPQGVQRYEEILNRQPARSAHAQSPA
jgi:dTDP-glucose pyrophosphorylase